MLIIPIAQTASWSKCPECTIGPQASPDRWLMSYQTLASATRPNTFSQETQHFMAPYSEKENTLINFQPALLGFLAVFYFNTLTILCVCVQMCVCVPCVCKYRWKPEDGVVAL
jgi:hypothetical protein